MYTDYKTDDKPTPKAAWSESHFVASVLSLRNPRKTNYSEGGVHG